MKNKNIMNKTLFGALVFTACVSVNHVLAEENESTLIETKEITVNPKILAQERTINKAVEKAILAIDGKRIGGLYNNREKRELDIREAALTALEHNTSIKRGNISKEIAEQIVLEAKAIFDPVFAVTVSGNKTLYYDRTENDVMRFKSGTSLVGGQHRIYMSATSPVQYLQYNATRPEGFYASNIEASTRPITGDVFTKTIQPSISTTLPWGQWLGANLTIVHKDNKWVVNNDVKNQQLVGSYKRPWTVSGTLSASLPVIGGKGYGRDNIDNLGVDVARHNRSKASWGAKATINDVLANVDYAYLTLAGTVMQLNNAIKAENLAKEMMQRTNRLFSAGEITKSSKSQVDAQFLKISALREETFRNYALASHQLGRLLNMQDEPLVLPVGYSQMLEKGVDVDVEILKSFEAIENNPSYVSAIIDMQIADRVEKARRNEAKPDIKVSASITAAQSNAVFGFKTLENSFEHLFDPDSITMTTGINYSRSLFNTSPREAKEQAKNDADKARLIHNNVKNALRVRFNDAKTALESAKERSKIADKNAQLAQSVYNRAKRLQEVRNITAYEAADKLLSMLDAQNAYIQALVDLRKAETNLLNVAGVLASRYAERTAQTEVDLERVRVLASSGVLEHFAGETP